MPRGSSRSSRRSGPRRKLIWARNSFEVVLNAAVPPALAAPSRVDLLARVEASIGASLVGSTVVRTRGILVPFSFGTSDAIAWRVTAYVGDNNDIARAPNANDNAFDQLSENRDFFLFEPGMVPANAAAASTAEFVSGTDPMARIIDVRSSRKLEEVNQTVILDFSAAGLGVGAEAFQMYVDLSTLVMLP